MVGKIRVAVEQALELPGRYEIDQRVFLCPGLMTGRPSGQNAQRAKNLPLAHPVLQLAGAAHDLDRAASYVVQLCKPGATGNHGGAGPTVADLDGAGHLPEAALGQKAERVA